MSYQRLGSRTGWTVLAQLHSLFRGCRRAEVDLVSLLTLSNRVDDVSDSVKSTQVTCLELCSPHWGLCSIIKELSPILVLMQLNSKERHSTLPPLWRKI